MTLVRLTGPQWCKETGPSSKETEPSNKETGPPCKEETGLDSPAWLSQYSPSLPKVALVPDQATGPPILLCPDFLLAASPLIRSLVPSGSLPCSCSPLHIFLPDFSRDDLLTALQVVTRGSSTAITGVLATNWKLWRVTEILEILGVDINVAFALSSNAAAPPEIEIAEDTTPFQPSPVQEVIIVVTGSMLENGDKELPMPGTVGQDLSLQQLVGAEETLVETADPGEESTLQWQQGTERGPVLAPSSSEEIIGEQNMFELGTEELVGCGSDKEVEDQSSRHMETEVPPLPLPSASMAREQSPLQLGAENLVQTLLCPSAEESGWGILQLDTEESVSCPPPPSLGEMREQSFHELETEWVVHGNATPSDVEVRERSFLQKETEEFVPSLAPLSTDVATEETGESVNSLTPSLTQESTKPGFLELVTSLQELLPDLASPSTKVAREQSSLLMETEDESVPSLSRPSTLEAMEISFLKQKTQEPVPSLAPSPNSSMGKEGLQGQGSIDAREEKVRGILKLPEGSSMNLGVPRREQETNCHTAPLADVHQVPPPQGIKKARKVSFGAIYVKEFSVEESEKDSESDESIEEVVLDTDEFEEAEPGTGEFEEAELGAVEFEEAQLGAGEFKGAEMCTDEFEEAETSCLKCAFCDEAFVLSEELLRHHELCGERKRPPGPQESDFEIEKEEKDAVTVCPYCEEKCESQDLLLQHSVECLLQKRPYVCTECGHTSRSHSNLLEHQESHRKSKELVCNICKETFKLRRTAKNHMKMKHNVKRSFCIRVGCGVSFATMADLRKHYREAHNSDTTSCNETVDDDNNKEADCAAVKLEGEDIGGKIVEGEDGVPELRKKFNCNICEDTFLTARSLKAHKMKGHTSGSFKCDICNKVIMSAKKMSVHMKKDHYVDRFFCTVQACEVSFGSKKAVKLHTKKEHTNMCEKINSNAREMTKKDKSKEISEPDQGQRKERYKCDLCPETFKRGSSLRVHTKAVHKVDRFYCKYVGCESEAIFKTQEAVILHMRKVHPHSKKEATRVTGEEQSSQGLDSGKHKCKICLKVFKAANYLKDHKTRYHNKNQEDKVSQVELKNTCKLSSRKIMCTFCRKVFNSVNSTELAQKHMKKAHNVLKIFCQYCQASFANKKSETTHQKVFHPDIDQDSNSNVQVQHLGESLAIERKYKCTICSKFFKSSKSIQTHSNKYHKVQVYFCHQPGCKVNFPEEEALKKHTEEMHRVRDIKKYKCGKCGEVFRQQNERRKHMTSLVCNMKLKKVQVQLPKI